MSINKLTNAWISNDTSLNGGVSLINSGKSTFKDTVSIGLAGATGQQLTVNGDINYTGNLLKNGTVDTVSISGTNNFTGQNTFSNLTFNNVSSNISVNNYNFSLTTAGNNTPILNNVSGTNSITGWTFSGNNYTIFIYNSVNYSPDNRYIPNYPLPSATYLVIEKTEFIELENYKYLLPRNLLVSEFMCIIKTKMNKALDEKKAIFTFVKSNACSVASQSPKEIAIAPLCGAFNECKFMQFCNCHKVHLKSHIENNGHDKCCVCNSNKNK